DPQYRPMLNVLVPLSGGLERRLDIAEAVLNSAPENPDLRESLKSLLAALEDYESTHSTRAATAIRKQFDALRPHAANGGEKLGLALRKDYFNFNLRVVASEAYLNKLIQQSRDQSGPVRDFILGADVFGNQTTHTNIGL